MDSQTGNCHNTYSSSKYVIEITREDYIWWRGNSSISWHFWRNSVV